MFVAPARGVDPNAVQRARERLEASGFRVLLPDNFDRRRGYLAGSDQERADELMEAFRREDVDAVFPFTGGYGTTRLLDRLDFGQIAAHPKILIGFSDITGLHLAIAAKTNLVTFHTPNPDTGLGRPEGMDPYAERFFWRCLRADQNQAGVGFAYEVPDPQKPLLSLRPGTARGRLIGGNLSLVCATMGTPYEIQTQGRILFLEDVHEAPYRIDRYLSQLRLAGKLDSPSAVILGQFTEADPSPNEDSLTVDEVLTDYFGAAPYPVVANFPAGHVSANATLPIGMEMEVEVRGEISQVRVLKNPVRSSSESRR
jgi:muramoyltetrapeptide carboxypeptidase